MGAPVRGTGGPRAGETRATRLPRFEATVPGHRSAVAVMLGRSTAHMHEWRLVAVEWNDFSSVQQWDCAGCNSVEYR